MMTSTDGLQDLCQRGQEKLTETDYLAAEALLSEAEGIARGAGDWDTVARVYMPLQEARRQRRQLCGEGVVVMDLLAGGEGDELDGRGIVQKYPQGQLLVAGWGSIGPALEVRRLQVEQGLYVETFLGAVYPIVGGARAVVIVPTEEVALPEAEERPIDRLIGLLPAHSIVMPAGELVRGARKGDAGTFAETMSLWERLHLPFLALADATVDPVQRVEAYRRTIRVDYACELAHQKLSNVAHELARLKKKGG